MSAKIHRRLVKLDINLDDDRPWTEPVRLVLQKNFAILESRWAKIMREEQEITDQGRFH
jgi:hypothetical protein